MKNVYPTLRDTIPPGEVDAWQAVPAARFSVQGVVPCIGIVVYKDFGVLLVEPLKAPEGKKESLIFPQGRIRFSQTYMQAIHDCSRRELGLLPEDVVVRPRSLSWFEGHVPKGRTEGARITKSIEYFAVALRGSAKVAINRDILRRSYWVTSPEEFEDITECDPRNGHRTHKCLGMCTAVEIARDRNLFWSDIDGQLAA